MWQCAYRALATCALTSWALAAGCGSNEGGTSGGGTKGGDTTDADDGVDGAGDAADDVTTSGPGDSTNGGSTSGGDMGTTSGGSDAGTTGGTGGGPPTGTPYVFVGSGSQIRAYVMDPADGSLTAAGSRGLTSLDFMSLGPDDRTVFVATNSEVSAYAYDPGAESFTFIDSENTSGGTHVMADPSGQYVFTASYGDGELAFHTYSGASGFGPAQVFSPGDNAHQVRVSRAGTEVFVPCLGEDYVAQYRLDPAGGTLIHLSNVGLDMGAGPRHMDFHPTADVAYVLAELSSDVFVFDIDGSGTLVPRPGDTVPTHDDATGHWSSDIHVSPDGKHVYAVNREAPEIVRFVVEPNHALTRMGADALSAVVRAFTVDPGGGYLQIGGEDGRLAALQIDGATGGLTETSAEPGLGNIRATEIRYIE